MLLPEEELPLPDISDYVQHLIELQRCCQLFFHRFRSSPITMCCLLSIVLFTATWVLSLVIGCVSPKLGPNPPPLQLASPPWTFWRERTNDANMPRILLWHRDMKTSSNTAERWPSSNVVNCSLSVPATFPAPPVKQSVQCEVTDNRVRLEWSDAVVFDVERVSPEDMPTARAGFQSWVLWARKHVSPVGGTTTSRNETRLDVLTCDASHPAVDTQFDWTMGRREDSDIKTPYKSWVCDEVGNDTASRSTRLADVVRRNRNVQGYRARKDAAWIVGSCDWNLCVLENLYRLGRTKPEWGGDGGQQSVSVDMILDCGRSTCESRQECVREIAAHYRFVIVSADTDCFHSPYELIYDAFEYDLVPVVLAPPRQAVSVPWFSGVFSTAFDGFGELVAYLHRLTTTPEAYEKYFAWKESCSMVTNDIHGDLCSLCSALNVKSYSGPARRSLYWWMFRKSRPHCEACPMRQPGFGWAFPEFRTYRHWL